MLTPTESDFSPLSQVITRFGLANPLEVLPGLANRLETVDVSSAHLDRLSTELTGLADRLDRSSGGVQWHGDAASGFRHRQAEVTTSLRTVAQVTQDVVHCHQDSKITNWDLVVWITLAIAILTLVVAAILAVMIATAVQSGGTSVAAGIVMMSVHTATVTAEILGAIGTVSWLLSSIFSEIRGKLVSPDIVCPALGTQPGH